MAKITREYKHRPSMSSRELGLLSRALFNEVQRITQQPNFNHQELADIIDLKKYCDSFTVLSTEESILAQFRATQNQPAEYSPFASAIDNPALTDEQKYDILSTRDSSTFTEEESTWFLNKGTMVKMRRMMTKPITGADL